MRECFILLEKEFNQSYHGDWKKEKNTVLAMQAVEYFKYCLLETKQGEEWPDYSGSEGEGAVSRVSTGVC